MQRDDGPDYEQRDAQLREEGWARHQFAEAVELAARLGNHPPEEAKGLERALLTYAGLPINPEPNPAQIDLNI